MKEKNKKFSSIGLSNEIAKGTNVGLSDYKAYLTEKASVDELKLQNSYFINALYTNSEYNQKG